MGGNRKEGISHFRGENKKAKTNEWGATVCQVSSSEGLGILYRKI